MRASASADVTDNGGRPSFFLRRGFIAAALVVVLFVAATLRVLVWPAQGMPAHVDAIVMLAGPGDRLTLALKLAREHRAPTLVISRGNQGYGGPCPPPTQGVKTLCFEPVPANTRGEAEFVGRLAKQYHWHSIALVATREQDTRARIQVKRCLSSQVYVMTAAESLGSLPYQIAYGWGALFKALVLYRSC